VPVLTDSVTAGRFASRSNASRLLTDRLVRSGLLHGQLLLEVEVEVGEEERGCTGVPSRRVISSPRSRYRQVWNVEVERAADERAAPSGLLTARPGRYHSSQLSACGRNARLSG